MHGLEFLEKGLFFILIEKDISFGFPSKLLDYLYVGRPVIYASPAYNKNLMQSGCCIEASNNDPKHIADAVIKILSMSEERWRQMCISARSNLSENHDIEKMAETHGSCRVNCVALR